MTNQIIFFAGSARKDSFNKKLAKAAYDMAAAAGADARFIDLADFQMPLYDGDLEAADGLPEKAKELKEIVAAATGLFIACPEYNSGYPALLKNTIDWISRPDPTVEGDFMLRAFAGKQAVVVSASPGGFGGMRALVPLRMLLGNIGVTVLPASISASAIHEKMDAEGNLTDDGTKGAISMAVQALIAACA
ncbi:MAG: NAD(P)H-dependent oxidoreductase [Alphaproteobacteria bacterium]